MLKAGSMLVTADFTKEFNDIIQGFKKDDVLVGIPAGSPPKEDGGISNAAILAINEFGSPANHIPPRPVMQIGIKNAQDAIAEEYKKAAINALKNGVGTLEIYYNRAGVIASQLVKKVINDQDGILPPAASTLAAREARGFKGEKALLVTGQLRNSITYLVRRKV